MPKSPADNYYLKELLYETFKSHVYYDIGADEFLPVDDSPLGENCDLVGNISDARVQRVGNKFGVVTILLNNEGDHPTCITVDTINNTFTIEGYD